MSAVKRRDTEAELTLRRQLWRAGLRYLLHDARLPGTPDVVLVRARVALFVDGDFWHGRMLQEKGLKALRSSFRPGSRAFWVGKIRRNVERDRCQTLALRMAKWKVIRIWERDILRSPERTALRVIQLVRSRLQRIDAKVRDA
jgi:DNA mismatch endonuclease (patch repair protein)